MVAEPGLRQLPAFISHPVLSSTLTPSQPLHTGLFGIRLGSKTSGLPLWEKTAPRRFTLSLDPSEPPSLLSQRHRGHEELTSQTNPDVSDTS